MKKTKYELPELEEMKKLTAEFSEKADEFIKKQKNNEKIRAEEKI